MAAKQWSNKCYEVCKGNIEFKRQQIVNKENTERQETSFPKKFGRKCRLS